LRAEYANKRIHTWYRGLAFTVLSDVLREEKAKDARVTIRPFVQYRLFGQFPHFVSGDVSFFLPYSF